jgi:hypothetical protein
MRKVYMFMVLFGLAAIPSHAQSTTNTTCTGSGSQVNCTSNTIGGTNNMTNTHCSGSANQINCTSNTIGGASSTDNSALEAERARENYESAQQAGSALGLAIGAGINVHRRNSYCKKYPRGIWRNPNGTVFACGGVRQAAVSDQQPTAVSIMTGKEYCQGHPQSSWFSPQRGYVACSEILQEAK